MKLKRPIVFFDLETTGVDVVKDRIVQICTVKINTDKKAVIKIPKEATDVHGITNEMIADKPTFKAISKSLYEYLKDCDIGGYNSNQFDVPLLVEEFNRCGINFTTEERAYIDVMRIEQELNPRTLEAVYKRYTGSNLEGAHNAKNDVKATIAIFSKQVEILTQNNNISSMKDIDIYSQGENKRIDLAGKLCEINGVICWNFGKEKGKPIKDTKSYAEWFLNQSVPTETAVIIKEELKK